MSWASFIFGGAKDESLPDIFPIPIAQAKFVEIDVQNIFTRILMDALERTQGIPDEKKNLLWDNCLASEKQDGLVTLVAKAMVAKGELFLVFYPATNLVGKANQSDEQKIREAYKTKAEPVSLDAGATGIYLTFKNFVKSDMVQFYSALEYCAVGGLWKQGNLSKAIQIKINDLRGSVSLSDSAKAKEQAKKMADGLADGKDVLMDAKDILETLKPDMSATNETIEFIAKKQSFYLGLPPTYFGAEAKSGIGDTGKGDSKKTEQGLKGYYFSIVKPTIENLFGIKTTFKSEDAEGMETALKVLETFDRTSDEHLSAENKTLIVNKSFGLDEDEEGDEPEDPPPTDPNAPPGQPPPAPGKQQPPPKAG